MRSLSKERLSKMHAMLDKQLQNQEQTLSNHSSLSQNRKQRSNFSHLRYTSNINLDEDLQENTRPIVNERPREVSSQKQSLFKKSLEKNQKARLELNKQSRKQYGGLSSSQESSLEKETKGSLRGSRKNEINQLEKKLLDLEKKMENINLSSSEDDEDSKVKTKILEKFAPKAQTNTYNKNDAKRSFNSLKLQQNNVETKTSNRVDNIQNLNDGTARFSESLKNQPANKKQKLDFKSNLPLSHRKNTPSDDQESSNSDDQYEMQYNKFVKVTRQTKNSFNQRELKKADSSEEEDSSDQKPKGANLNKSISEQIQRLSIMNKEPKIATNSKNAISKDKLTQNPPQKSLSRQRNAKINTISIQPERKMTVQTDILEPKYQLQMNKNKSKSKSKKSIKLPKNSLSKEKAFSIKNTNRSEKQHSTSKKKIQRNLTNLDNSFRSDNSVKSKKSVNSLRSVGSNKSLSRNEGTQQGKIDNIEEKKYIKRIQNLEKQLQHYKRLSKRYETQISDYKLLEIQYKKMESQFRKSQQIRVEQKKIIENFRSKAMNG